MAIRVEDSEGLPAISRNEMFVVRYPDFPQWLDGNTWEIDIATELHEPVPNFRSSLYYQAKTMGMKLATKMVTRAEGRKVILVRAY